MSEIESESGSRANTPTSLAEDKKIDNTASLDNEHDNSGTVDSGMVERSIVSPHWDSNSEKDDSKEEKKYSGMQSFKVQEKIIEDEDEANRKKSEIEEEGDETQVLPRVDRRARQVITPITETDRSYSASPAFTEHTEQLPSMKGTAISTPVHISSKRSALSTPMMTPVPVRSKNTGRLSPTAVTTPQSVSVGNQPMTLTRFNEPLKYRKGKHFVDYEIPGPTVVYVPHKQQTHGQWTNVTVERKPNGRYVVIEQRPVHTRFTDVSFGSKGHASHDIYGRGFKVHVKKSPWNYSTKGNFIERQADKGFYEPYLPPIKSKYVAVESKIGSWDNQNYVPGGGTHKIPNFKLKWEAESRVGSLPTTGRLSPVSHAQTERNSLKLPEITPRYGASADSGSFSSIHYSPGGSVFIRKNKSNAKSRIGSLDNASHKPIVGDVDLPKNKVNWKSGSKVGSLDNITHLPRSSNIQIFSEKLDWKTSSKISSWDNADYKPKKKRFHVPHFNDDVTKTASSRIGSLANINHKPGGGRTQIVNEKVAWKGKAKIDSHWKFNVDYKGLFDNDFDSDSESEFREQTYSRYSGTV